MSPSLRLTPPSHPPILYSATRPFDAYVDACRHHIERFRLDLIDPIHNETIIKANLPREHLPTTHPDHGVLLIHGLLDSPMQLESLELEFAKQGYWVRSILLPGHGTVPGELLSVHYQDWLESVGAAITVMKKTVATLTVVGFSTGAALALYHAFQGLPIDKLILFAPPLQIKNPLAPLTGWARFPAMLTKRAHWFHIGNDNDYAKYQSISFHAVYQVYQLSQQIAAIQKPLSIPIYMILTDSDEAISTPRCEAFFKQQPHPESRCLIYSHLRNHTPDPRITLEDPRDPTQRILDYSHVCLSVSPENPHYGQEGDYQEWSHYDSWWGRWFQQSGPDYLGALTAENLKQFHLCRLTYNPRFETLKNALLQFVQQGHNP